MPGQILVIDDEAAVRKSVALAFEREGLHVVQAAGGREGLELLEKTPFDLIILDVMMDEMDGFYVVEVIRKKGIHTPVLFLSGNAEEQSKILGISLGGDDYLTKPFSLSLLTTKAHALMRRSQEYNTAGTQQRELVCGPFVFSTKTYRLSKDGEEIRLTSKETALMRFLMENQDQVFTKEQLYQNVWDQAVVDDNTIMVYIKRLRNKIEDDPKQPQYLRTAWGIGYIFGHGGERKSGKAST